MHPPTADRASLSPRPRRRSVRATHLALGVLALLMSIPPVMADEAGSAAMLRATYARHRPEMEQNKFGVPLQLESTQTSDTLKGDIHALLDQPFDKVQQALAAPGNWCDILILHPNVKGCQLSAVGTDGQQSLTVNLGRSEVPVQFSYKAEKAQDYLDYQHFSRNGLIGQLRFEGFTKAQATYGVKAAGL